MQRRQFIKRFSTLPLSFMSSAVFGEGIIEKIGNGSSQSNPSVWPEERIEKRQYDKSKPQNVVWHTALYQNKYPKREELRTVGFVEGVSDRTKILYTPGVLVRREVVKGGEPGFYLYFRMSLTWLALPRRSSTAPDVILDRYAFDEQFSVKANEGVDADFLRIDFRDMRLIDEQETYHPQKKLLKRLSSTGALLEGEPQLVHLHRPEFYPSKNVREPRVHIGEVLFFEIPYLPTKFKLELPTLFVRNVEVPLPTCYFEPYDILNQKWV